jgi:hypothetical protein
VTVDEYYLTAKLVEDFRYSSLYSDVQQRRTKFKDYPNMEGLSSRNLSFVLSSSNDSTMTFVYNSFELILQILEITFLQESNLVGLSKNIYFQSIQPFLLSSSSSSYVGFDGVPLPFNSYSLITSQYYEWKKEREVISSHYIYHEEEMKIKRKDNIKKKKLKIEYITYGSNMTEGLENLIFSSIISGVKLKVGFFLLVAFSLLSFHFLI